MNTLKSDLMKIYARNAMLMIAVFVISVSLSNAQSLAGKWQMIRTGYNITKQNGSQMQTKVEIKSKGMVVIWEFFRDGKFTATDGKSPVQLGRWKVNGNKLIISGDWARELSQAVGQNGDLVFEIETSSKPGAGTLLTTKADATKISNYKKNILYQEFQKL